MRQALARRMTTRRVPQAAAGSKPRLVVALLVMSVLVSACPRDKEEENLPPASLREVMERVQGQLKLPLREYEAVWPKAADYYGTSPNNALALFDPGLRNTMVGMAFIQVAHNSPSPDSFQRFVIQTTARNIPSYAQTRSFEGLDFYAVVRASSEVTQAESTLPAGVDAEWIRYGVLDKLVQLRRLPPKSSGLQPKVRPPE